MKDSESISTIEDNDFINIAISKKQQVEVGGRKNESIFNTSRHGFDEDDIGTLRSLFSLEIQNMVNSTERLEDETESEHRRRIEDAWVRNNIRHFTSSGAGGERGRVDSNTDFLIGFALGFVLGFVMMFWIADEFVHT